MIDLTELDRRRATHEARVARINRDGWMHQARKPRPGRRALEAILVARWRQPLGKALIRIGERVQGSNAAPVIGPAATFHAPDPVG